MGESASYKACIFLAPVNAAGVLQGDWFHFGEAFPFQFSFPSEITKFKGGTCETDQQTVDTMETSGEPTGSITTYSYNVENVAMHLAAERSTNADAGSSLSAESVTVGKFGEFVDIGTQNLDNDIVVQDATDTITYVNYDDDPANADYKLVRAFGMIMPLSTGTISENEELHVSGTELADTSERITIKKGSGGLYAVRSSSVNRVNLQTRKDEFYCCRLVATNEVMVAMDPDSTDRAQLDFEFTPQLPTGGNSYGTIDGLPKRYGA